MTDTKQQVEQRKLKRFRVRAGAFVMLKPSGITACRLLNISMDGLTFDCVSSQAEPVEATELDIFVTDAPIHVSDIPCRSIWDLTVYARPSVALYRRRCGVQFGELTPDQKFQLEYFIQNFTSGEEKV
jgi:hypothetical protein